VSDEKFFPVFEAASSKKKCIVFLHPAAPLGAEQMREHGFVRSLGYPFETTACLAKMAYAGIFDRFPSLKILSAHLGGAFPYLSGRIDTAWSNFEDSKGDLRDFPSRKIRNSLIVDTISYNSEALRFAAEFLGIDRLVFGTDYPFPWGIKDAKESVEKTFNEDELEKVYSENYERELR
jgi:aminocarboxymuconate-semialdehyde decarboxylase